MLLQLPDPPLPAELREIAPGLSWIRLPLPFRLAHVNCWALDDGDGWSIIDCGVDDEATRSIWDRLWQGPLSRRPLTRLIATHGHTDHVGLAGLFVERFGSAFHATRAEWMSARLRHADADASELPGLGDHLAKHGCSDEVARSYVADRLRTSSYLGRPPSAHRRLREGDDISMGGRCWRVIVAGGHADEHASFYCAADGILIAGDQVLPKISPVVVVGPSEPEADPLGEYLSSLARFAQLPDNTLVLPSHGDPFFGLHRRLESLARHHDERLSRLSEIIASPKTAAEAASVLFERAMKEGQGRLALGETLAHLNRLVRSGKAERHFLERMHRFTAIN